MVITVAQLSRAVPATNKERAAEFCKTFNDWSDKFGINTPLRAAHFLAQLYMESGALSHVVENLNYSAEGLMKTWPSRFNRQKAAEYARKPEKIANCVYANRMGNGDEASGDGWKYRGRGYVQLTGKSAYQAYQNSGFCVGNLLAHPEWLEKSPGNVKSAMWFWWSRKLSTIADRDNGLNANDICKEITKVVNGGYSHLSDRQYYMRRFKREFGVQ